jgi:hypothetical protein
MGQVSNQPDPETGQNWLGKDSCCYTMVNPQWRWNWMQLHLPDVKGPDKQGKQMSIPIFLTETSSYPEQDDFTRFQSNYVLNVQIKNKDDSRQTGWIHRICINQDCYAWSNSVASISSHGWARLAWYPKFKIRIQIRINTFSQQTQYSDMHWDRLTYRIDVTMELLTVIDTAQSGRLSCAKVKSLQPDRDGLNVKETVCTSKINDWLGDFTFLVEALWESKTPRATRGSIGSLARLQSGCKYLTITVITLVR